MYLLIIDPDGVVTVANSFLYDSDLTQMTADFYTVLKCTPDAAYQWNGEEWQLVLEGE